MENHAGTSQKSHCVNKRCDVSHCVSQREHLHRHIYTGTRKSTRVNTQSTRSWWRDIHTCGSASFLHVHCNVCYLHIRAWSRARGSADGSPRADHQLFLFIQYTFSLTGWYNTFVPPSTHAFAVSGCLQNFWGPSRAGPGIFFQKGPWYLQASRSQRES